MDARAWRGWRRRCAAVSPLLPFVPETAATTRPPADGPTSPVPALRRPHLQRLQLGDVVAARQQANDVVLLQQRTAAASRRRSAAPQQACSRCRTHSSSTAKRAVCRVELRRRQHHIGWGEEQQQRPAAARVAPEASPHLEQHQGVALHLQLGAGILGVDHLVAGLRAEATVTA